MSIGLLTNQWLAAARSVVQKSVVDESALPNSVFTREQADRFIDLVVDQSELLSIVTVERKAAAKGSIPKLNLGDIVMEGASSRSTAKRRVPTESVVTYDMVKYRLAFDLATDFEDDNIEGNAFRDKLVNMFTKQTRNNTELAAVNSDSSLVTGDAQSDTNNLYGVNDGWHKILLDNVPAAQQLDCAGKTWSEDLFFKLRRMVPKRFRPNFGEYRYLLPPSGYDHLTRLRAARVTDGGDAAFADGSSPTPWGIRKIAINHFPEDLAVTATGTNDGAYVWLTPPSNLIWFVRREMSLEWERQPRADLTEATMYTRMDFEVMDPDMVVLAKNIRSESGTPYTLT
jgi:hypothetical protein